jgi:hypothetical protein
MGDTMIPTPQVFSSSQPDGIYFSVDAGNAFIYGMIQLQGEPCRLRSSQPTI